MNQSDSPAPDPQAQIDAMLQFMKRSLEYTIPLSAMPPLPETELARKILELQTVDVWLTQQQAGLRAVLQSLLTQQAANAAEVASDSVDGAPPQAGSNIAADAANAWWNVMQQQFLRTVSGLQTPIVPAAPTEGTSPAPRKRELYSKVVYVL